MKSMQFLIRMLILAAGLATSEGLLAHNTLQETLPADGVLLSQPPEEIELTFSDATYLSVVTLSTTDGDEIALDGELPKDYARHFSIPLPGLDPGEYRVSWQVEGMDTHKISGQFTFSLSDSD